MSELEKLSVVIRYEFLKHIRRKRLYIILAIALVAEALVLILIPALMHHYPSDVKVMAALLTIGASMAALGAVFFAGDAIAGEYEGKTGFLLFTNPINRETLWIGKYIASFIAVALLMIFTYIIMAVALLVIYRQVPSEIFQSFGMAMYYAAAVLSVTFLFSAISRGSMGATIMSLVFVWVICDILESVLAFTSNPYWFVLKAGADSIAMSYGSMSSFIAGLGGVSNSGHGADMLSILKTPSLGMAAFGLTIYFVGGLVGSIYLSRRRQLS